MHTAINLISLEKDASEGTLLKCEKWSSWSLASLIFILQLLLALKFPSCYSSCHSFKNVFLISDLESVQNKTNFKAPETLHAKVQTPGSPRPAEGKFRSWGAFRVAYGEIKIQGGVGVCVSKGRLERSGGKRARTRRKSLKGSRSMVTSQVDIVTMASQGLPICLLDSNPPGILTPNCPVWHCIQITHMLKTLQGLHIDTRANLHHLEGAMDSQGLREPFPPSSFFFLSRETLFQLVFWQSPTVLLHQP